MLTFKRIISIVLMIVMVLSVNALSAIDVSAAKAGDSFKGRTVCEALGMDGAAYILPIVLTTIVIPTATVRAHTEP